MNTIHSFLWPILLLGIAALQAQDTDNENVRQELSQLLDRWHRAAAEADFEEYFGLMSEQSVFIGTDASEHWDFTSFREFSKPYFERGRAWTFSAVERTLYLDDQAGIAWFDELLDTQMGLCRGSGVLKHERGGWKIRQYVLSITVPNEQVDGLMLLKSAHDSLQVRELRGAGGLRPN